MAAGLATRPPVVAFARGLEVLALGLEAAPEPEAGFFVVVLVLVLVLVVLVLVLAGVGMYGLRAFIQQNLKSASLLLRFKWSRICLRAECPVVPRVSAIAVLEGKGNEV